MSGGGKTAERTLVTILATERKRRAGRKEPDDHRAVQV